jgi:nucleoid DNA-binding protein
MSNSRLGRDIWVAKVREALTLNGKQVCRTKKDAEQVVHIVLACLEETVHENLEIDNFAVKLDSVGKLTVRHKPSIKRLIPFTQEVRHTYAKRKVKFTTLGQLRKDEIVKEPKE